MKKLDVSVDVPGSCGDHVVAFARANTVVWVGSDISSEFIISGAPWPMKATEPSGVINEMLKFGSAGWTVPVMAASRLPSEKAAPESMVVLRGSLLFIILIC